MIAQAMVILTHVVSDVDAQATMSNELGVSIYQPPHVV